MAISLETTELAKLIREASYAHSFKIGENYMVRTVTMYYVGTMVDATPTDLVLDNCSWVADTGRWSTCVLEGKCSEVEPMGNGVIISRLALIDVIPWKHELFPQTVS